MKVDLYRMPPIPTTSDDRDRLRSIGRNAEMYHEMVEQLPVSAVFTDELANGSR
jgi:hypothetical protein